MREPRAQLAWLSLAMFFGMTLWFSATAATASIVGELHLTTAEAAWLTMAVQGGFVVGTLVSAVFTLPDIVNPRRLFAAGCLVGATTNAALVVTGAPAALIGLRVMTGAALAWVYPPGMKIAAGWFERRRGTALGILIGALTVGSAFPHLLAAASAVLPWRDLMLAASALALAGGAVVLTAVGDGPYVTNSVRFEPSAIARVFSERGTRLATLGYLGHMWELYAVWTWIATFAAASLAARGGARGATFVTGPLASGVAFLTIACGAFGSAAAGLFADRVGKARVAAWAMLVSGTCAALAGIVYARSPVLLVGLAVVWGVAVVADSGQLSALVAEHSPRDHVGTALTVQTCSGFLLTMASIRLVPMVAANAGWEWAFACLVPGPLLGALALRGLITPP
ncbi:MAG: MFS transporter [Betaproteobacteria bacterium]